MRPSHLLIAGALACLTASEAIAQAPIDRAAWMAGCWRRQTNDRVVDEQWMAPAGGVMLGMGRTVVNGALREFEYVRISDVNGALVYHAEPSGQKPADFKAKSVTGEELVFEDLTHDFPQRVRYRRVGADSMVARIEGVTGGRERAIDYPYGRVSCAAATGRNDPRLGTGSARRPASRTATDDRSSSGSNIVYGWARQVARPRRDAAMPVSVARQDSPTC